MTIVKYKNQSGVVYAYDQTSVYDPERKQSRPKRTYLGRVDPETGEIISTKGKKGRPPKDKDGEKTKAPEGKDFQAAYNDLLRELEESRSRVAALAEENKKLLSRIQQLSGLLLSVQGQIQDAMRQL